MTEGGAYSAGALINIFTSRGWGAYSAGALIQSFTVCNDYSYWNSSYMKEV